MNTSTQLTVRSSSLMWLAGVGAAVVFWAFLYSELDAFSQLAVSVLPLEPHSRLWEATSFFLYEVPKVLLLTGVIFVMGVIRSFFSAERTRALLTGRNEGLGNFLAGALGIVTPFCSCSAVPMFIGFVSAGLPLGVTFSFLIAAPMVNEVALGLLLAMFGWRIALLYLGFGLGVAISAGWVLGRLHVEHWVEDWVLAQCVAPNDLNEERISWPGWEMSDGSPPRRWGWFRRQRFRLKAVESPRRTSPANVGRLGFGRRKPAYSKPQVS